MSTKQKDNIVSLTPAKNKKSSTERIWGKAVYSHGYAGIPSIMIKGQKRLGLSPIQFNILIQLLDYWHEPSRKPFPTKQDIADRIGVTAKTVQNNIRGMEQAGLVRREIRKTASGDFNSNIYHLDGLIAKVRELEPDFAELRKQKALTKKKAETPKGLR